MPHGGARDAGQQKVAAQGKRVFESGFGIAIGATGQGHLADEGLDAGDLFGQGLGHSGRRGFIGAAFQGDHHFDQTGFAKTVAVPLPGFAAFDDLSVRSVAPLHVGQRLVQRAASNRHGGKIMRLLIEHDSRPSS